VKIRTGFVSNSSSSSFVVAFKNIPKTVEELTEMLFGDEIFFVNPYGGWDSEDMRYTGRPSATLYWPVQEIAEIVFKDMKKPATEQEVTETISCGWIDGYPDLDNYRTKDRDYDWDAYHQTAQRLAKEKADQFLSENPDCTFYAFSYSDNDGELKCSMEHGNLFRRLPHLQISCH
jgi:hypothetical protein